MGMLRATRRMRGLIGSLLLAALIALALFGDRNGGGRSGQSAEQPGPATRQRAVRAPVTRVVDGDTIEVRIAGDSEDIRYIGIDTPETVKPGTPVQCFGPQASALNHRLVDGRTVGLVFDRERRDVYGRLLAYVFVGREFVNARLVQLGYARTLTIPPNVAHSGLFHRLARSAGREGLGLWGAC
jgi:micrococcal nuclease